MLQPISTPLARRTLEFGIYRDGDNNLDTLQKATLTQALRTSERDGRIEFTVEDTTSLPGDRLHTDQFTIRDGAAGRIERDAAHDMSDEQNLARFVARTLDNAERCSSAQTWIDLVDHGGGDGGGLQTHDGHCMTMPNIGKAIADGVAMHAQAHPEDAARHVDGIVANQCLMDTLGFADALSHAGVTWLAASPETMLAPGVPSDVAQAIANHADDPQAMAHAVVNDVMRTKYDGGFERYAPAAAFDVLDLSAQKIERAETAIRAFNDTAVRAARAGSRAALRDDVQSVAGMARFPGAGDDLPWFADRPAMAVYDAIARDARLDANLRRDAAAARDAVGSLVMAHRETNDFAPFDGADYYNAAGPTIHAPVNAKQIDPWASHGISETNNAFYHLVGQDRFARAIA